MHEYLQPLVPTLADLAASVLQRVAATGRAILRSRTTDADVSRAPPPAHRFGHVSLVGAGPGDPDLLTLKALKALAAADVVLHDQLVSHEILALVPKHAQPVDVGKKGYGRACKQSDINELMVAFARAGRRVVRLKGGDPLVFGRLEEEIGALEAAGIGFDVVPGISAAQGAAASLGVPLTRRRGARRFQAITGHADHGRLPEDFDWTGLADPKANTAVYMPKATIADLCRELIRRGLPGAHPATAVFNATRRDEVVYRADLATLAQRISAAEEKGPCIILIGVAVPGRLRHGQAAHDLECRLQCVE
jgi:uroporphyrin-III C-methyltransferase/precorrin-2 dehydrogenase/sirohydrochlorin ferrochelatase